MREILRRNPLAFLLAVVMHVAIVAFLVVGVDWRERPKPVASDVAIVEATEVDGGRLAAQMEGIRQERAQRAAKQREEEQRLAELERRRQEEQDRLRQVEAQRETREAEEAQQRVEAQQRAQEEQARLEHLRQEQVALEHRREQEKIRIQELEAKRAEEDRRRQEAETKRAEEERRHKEAEAKRQGSPGVHEGAPWPLGTHGGGGDALGDPLARLRRVYHGINLHGGGAQIHSRDFYRGLASHVPSSTTTKLGGS